MKKRWFMLIVVAVLMVFFGLTITSLEIDAKGITVKGWLLKDIDGGVMGCIAGGDECTFEY